MKKSSSVQIMKMPFNPKEFKIGQSRIDFIPNKIEMRRNSATNARTTPSSQSYQLQLLRRENYILRRQNQQLKRQNQEIKSKTNNLMTIKTQQKTNKYRDIVRQKLESKTKNSRVTTQCQTGFFSKENSLDKSQMTIQQWYQNYKLSKQLPTLEDLCKISDKFFIDYCENYSQLKVLYQCLQTNKQSEKYLKLSQIINLYKIPLQYQKSPQTLFREISKSKDKSKIVKNKQKTEELCLEVLSPHETIQRFEKLLIKMSKSQQMIKSLRNNVQVLKFISKVQSIKN